MLLLGRRKGGKPSRRYMDRIKADMFVICVREKDALSRTNWRQKIHCDDT